MELKGTRRQSLVKVQNLATAKSGSDSRQKERHTQRQDHRGAGLGQSGKGSLGVRRDAKQMGDPHGKGEVHGIAMPQILEQIFHE